MFLEQIDYAARDSSDVAESTLRMNQPLAVKPTITGSIAITEGVNEEIERYRPMLNVNVSDGRSTRLAPSMTADSSPIAGRIGQRDNDVSGHGLWKSPARPSGRFQSNKCCRSRGGMSRCGRFASHRPLANRVRSNVVVELDSDGEQTDAAVPNRVESHRRWPAKQT